MFYLLRTEFKKKYIYLFLLFASISTIILTVIVASLVMMINSIILIYELSMIIASFSFCTYYYKTYNREDFLKTSYLSGGSKTVVKINLFLYLVFWLYIFSFIILGIIYFLFNLGLVNQNGFNGTYEPLPTAAQINWWFLMYCITMYVFFMVGTAFLFNHFFRKGNYIYGFIVILFIFDLRYSLTTYSPLFFYASDSDQYLLIHNTNSTVPPTLYSPLVLPWSMVGIRMCQIFIPRAYSNDPTFFQLYDLSHVDQFKSFNWLPYLYLIGIYLVPFVHSEIKRQI